MTSQSIFPCPAGVKEIPAQLLNELLGAIWKGICTLNSITNASMMIELALFTKWRADLTKWRGGDIRCETMEVT